MGTTSVDSELADRLARGEYVVDARGVAEAILRQTDRRKAARLSPVLEALERNRVPGLGSQLQAPAGADAA